jgi:acetate kinase
MENNCLIIINAGSSSLKFKIFTANNLTELFTGQISGFGTKEVDLIIKDCKTKEIIKKHIFTETDRDTILSQTLDTIIKLDKSLNIIAFGHRVVHGGSKFKTSTLVNNDVINYLKSINHLAPLHMPHNLKPIEILANNYPHIKQVVCFDTAFHTSAPQHTKMYAIPLNLTESDEIIRYGAHGTSYEYIVNELEKIDPALYSKKTIICHLGSGASICAVNKGKCFTTSMGFSVLEGLIMGTRPGNIDAGILLYLMNQKKYSLADLEKMLYYQSGILGLSENTNDFRILQQATDEKSKFALEVFNYNLVKNIGAMIAVLEGVDGIIFTAGVGENSPKIREYVLNKLSFLGIEIDNANNNKNALVITENNSKIKAMVIPTNEEVMIARHTINLIS